ncbi:calcium-responsive transcription factor-like [Acropora millepora]|uniref:calcium-responsive transcription factor-like n=1 Tax=Acropora millepora TaxID=45264 RepID=UPI001CF2C952|nr:calcium-responsive transcription factor-like [Acropora millepora]
MATESAETLSSESIQQQIMESEQVSAAEVLQNTMSATISSSIQTISPQNGGITTISTPSSLETMTTSEAMMATESISVTTQGTSSTLGTQEIIETKYISHVQVQDHEAVAGSQESLVISAHENVAIATSSSLEVPPQITNLASVASNYPWATRLHDCELIGDSYRGYVTNEVELDLILTLHKQHTNSCWGTRQSPSSAKPSIRLMWKSQYVPYDGIPFLNTGRRATVMECQYGPRRKGAVNKKQMDYDEHGNPLKRHRPTCPARIYVKKVRKFPEFRIDPNLEGKNVRQAQERALTALRLAGVNVGGEERYYVQLPLPIAHEYHDMDDIPLDPDESDGQGQRLNPDVMHKIRELVARGVAGIYVVKHCLKEYVEKELFANMEPPPRHNKSYFPTIIDIQNHIHQAQMALATGTLVPLPPLTDLPHTPPQLKEKTRKRKLVPEKLSQSSQTTADAIASIQQQYQASRLTTQDPQHLIQQTNRENYQGNETQLEIVQASDGQTAEVDISNQHQILITQGTGSGREEGQVVIVVNASSFFSGQTDSETPTTLSLTIPASQVASLSHASLHAGAGTQAVTFIPQQTNASPQTTGSTTTSQTVAFIPQSMDNSRSPVAFLASQQTENASQVPVSAAYLASHGQPSNILSMLDTALQASSASSSPVVTVGSNLGNVQIDTVSGQVTSTSADAEEVLNAGISSHNAKQIKTEQDRMDDEPPHKRQVLDVDFTSLVKEAVYNSQQGKEGGVNQQGIIATSSASQDSISTQLTALPQAKEDGNFMSVDAAQPVVMVTQSSLQSIQDVPCGVTVQYEENQRTVQDSSVPQKTTVDHYDNEQFTCHSCSPQIPVSGEQTPRALANSVETSGEITVSLETSQDVPVSIQTGSEGTSERETVRENCLKGSEMAPNNHDYNDPTQCSESHGDQSIPLTLLFENGQQVTEDESPVVSQNNSVANVTCDPSSSYTIAQ